MGWMMSGSFERINELIGIRNFRECDWDFEVFLRDVRAFSNKITPLCQNLCQHNTPTTNLSFPSLELALVLVSNI